MSIQTDFFLERAVHEATQAKAESLANVRDGHLRAEAAWRQLAERSARGDELRAKDAQRKADLAVEQARQAADAMRGGRD